MGSSKMKAIKLMTDYGCFPLWGVDVVGNIDPRALAISDELRSDLNRWAQRYDGVLNHDDPAQSRFKTPKEEDAFEKEGRRLWRELQKQLGPTYKVVYFSSVEQCVLE